MNPEKQKPEKQIADDPTMWVMDDRLVWRRVIHPGQIWAKADSALSFFITGKDPEREGSWKVRFDGYLAPFFDRDQVRSERFIWERYHLYVESAEEVRARGGDPNAREPLWTKRRW